MKQGKANNPHRAALMTMRDAAWARAKDLYRTKCCAIAECREVPRRKSKANDLRRTNAGKIAEAAIRAHAAAGAVAKAYDSVLKLEDNYDNAQEALCIAQREEARK